MLTMLLVFVVIFASAFVVASAIAALTRLLTRSDTLSLILGSLTMPALICGLLAYWVLTMEADDAPPGDVIIGSLVAIAVITPVAWLASHLTVKFLTRRTLRNGG